MGWIRSQASGLFSRERCHLAEDVCRLRECKEYLKGGKTSSEASFKRRGDSNRAGFRQEHRDNESCHAGTGKAELEFAEQVLDADGPCCHHESADDSGPCDPQMAVNRQEEYLLSAALLR